MTNNRQTTRRSLRTWISAACIAVTALIAVSMVAFPGPRYQPAEPAANSVFGVPILFGTEQDGLAKYDPLSGTTTGAPQPRVLGQSTVDKLCIAAKFVDDYNNGSNDNMNGDNDHLQDYCDRAMTAIVNKDFAGCGSVMRDMAMDVNQGASDLPLALAFTNVTVAEGCDDIITATWLRTNNKSVQPVVIYGGQ